MKTTRHNKQTPIESTENFRTSWEAMTLEQLEWMRANGTYGQRLIATRYLRDNKRGVE